MNSLADLAAFSPGLGNHAEGTIDVRAFARRRVEHLRNRVEAGDLDPDKLRHRLLARFGPSAARVVGEDGIVDFNRLQDLVTQQQAEKLRAKLERLFGDKADDIVGSDGVIDQVRISALLTADNIHNAEAKLKERFGDHADKMKRDDGSIDLDILRELLILDGIEQSYDPARRPREARPAAQEDESVLDIQPDDVERSPVSFDMAEMALELDR